MKARAGYLSGAQFKRRELGRGERLGAARLTSGAGGCYSGGTSGCRKQFVSRRLTGAPFFSTYSLLRNKRGIRSHEKRGRLQVSLVRSLPSWHGRAICTNDTSLGGKKEGEEERATPASNLCRSSLLQLLLSPSFNLPYAALALVPGSESGQSCGPVAARTGPRELPGVGGRAPAALPTWQQPLGASSCSSPSIGVCLANVSQVTSRSGVVKLPQTPRWAFLFSIRVALIRFILIHLQFAYN